MTLKPVSVIVIISLMLFVILNPAYVFAEFEREDYEEPAGSSFALLLNPSDGIYGISAGDGTWLKNTPVFGDFALSLFSNDIEESWYSGIGMTLRIMPHWKIAPFAGAGGAYNYSFKRREENPIFYEENDYSDQGDSYWGGHIEAGVRIWSSNRLRLFEICGRYVWSSLQGDRDYWILAISTGV